ncbi:MAG: glycosyltransferase family 4 protein [Acidimicrobiia bacterium]
MRLCMVVQRYGPEAAGGAERLCAEVATRLAARGHEVAVVTSCARDYATWENHHPEGVEVADGVEVHRLGVAHPRRERVFTPLNRRVAWGGGSAPHHLQREWMAAQGPLLPGLVPWLVGRAAGFHVCVFFTYLYWTTWAGLPAASRLTPTVLLPAAHDEPPLRLGLFRDTFRQPTALAFLSDEEADLVRARFAVPARSAVLGAGVDLDAGAAPGAGVDVGAFRRAFGLGERPYLVCVGRLDPPKGSDELFGFWGAYKSRNPGPLALVMVGDPVVPVGEHPDVVLTGVLPEAGKRAALAGAAALVAPSYFESFSMVLTEAWAAAVPVLVQRRCAVLVGQVRRAGGGIPYDGYAEFEAALDLLAERPGVAAALGEAGRRYVTAHYGWDTVLDRYERFLAEVARCRPPAPYGVGSRR